MSIEELKAAYRRRHTGPDEAPCRVPVEDLAGGPAESREAIRARRREAARAAVEAAAVADPAIRPLVDAGLTIRQAEIYLFVFRRSLATGGQPSIREIGDAFGITSTHGVVGNIEAIAIKGWWERDASSNSRSLRFRRTPSGAPFRGFILPEE